LPSPRLNLNFVFVVPSKAALPEEPSPRLNLNVVFVAAAALFAF
jgi:hypothetical protein